MLLEEGYLLRIFIGEADKFEGKLLYEWIVKKAREHGLSGATVFRGIIGYGGHSRIHSAKILDLSSDLPIVVEIMDTLEKINAFMPLIETAVNDGMATLEKVQIQFYRPRK